jgi:hypothetical protein
LNAAAYGISSQAKVDKQMMYNQGIEEDIKD